MTYGIRQQLNTKNKVKDISKDKNFPDTCDTWRIYCGFGEKALTSQCESLTENDYEVPYWNTKFRTYQRRRICLCGQD